MLTIIIWLQHSDRTTIPWTWVVEPWRKSWALLLPCWLQRSCERSATLSRCFVPVEVERSLVRHLQTKQLINLDLMLTQMTTHLPFSINVPQLATSCLRNDLNSTHVRNKPVVLLCHRKHKIVRTRTSTKHCLKRYVLSSRRRMTVIQWRRCHFTDDSKVVAQQPKMPRLWESDSSHQQAVNVSEGRCSPTRHITDKNDSSISSHWRHQEKYQIINTSSMLQKTPTLKWEHLKP